MDSGFENGYDKRNPAAILKYAELLLGKTFQQVLDDDSSNIQENKSNKGDMGQLIERHHFHYACNNDSRPDFPEAGVELKVTPFKENKNGTYSAKERLVLTKINYNEVVNEEFETSHFWTKSRLILLIYYLYRKEVLNNFQHQIKFVNLFTPPAEDVIIIRKDYDIIINKIKAGLAHELSESDTLYLAACTKGSKSTDRTTQPYSDIPAKPRAFSFKTSYMTYVLNNYIIPGKETYDAAFTVEEIQDTSFEDALKKRLEKYVGWYEDEIARAVSLEINKDNKSYHAILGCRMLGVKSNRVEEFVKAGILPKVIKFSKKKGDNQHFRIEDFTFAELDAESFDNDIIDEETGEACGWESSELYNLLKNRKYLFLIFWEETDGLVFKGCQMWGMPDKDIDLVRPVWQKLKRIVRDGVELIPTKWGKTYRVNNNLPGVSDNGIFHIRHHAENTYYELKDGSSYGKGSISDTDLLPNGERMTKQAYWLNRSYIDKQLDSSLVKKY